ncbi:MULTISPECIES: type VII secretion protein EccB [unclassified Actinopolyspora]|uniref:type VII secretion protein EccB n=1 Tax=unclassified Actinopolyspora TaxID=2639451 RepID=UPI0013F6603F|nr:MULTISPECIES: type VII secretion protein EccB [unclassified Actinopolyspora]NHD16634.1 type VII secretion protein EccB [Actinopolyspora sp. BKK2]NHE75503.1 type VII secretion protein EccB [Actinopolyspora sp. BKK1]
MASTPTTKSQVQAYKFVIRRMESALARKDAVMLHDPLGSHKRATIAGAILACIGMIGFLVWGLFSGQGTVPKPGSVVIAKGSGSVYVVTSDDRTDKRLIPMLNMASAKLLVMANGGGQGQAIEPTKVKEAALAELPRGPKTGIPNAPNLLPSPDETVSPAWAICDVAELNKALSPSKMQAAATVETTVVGGVADRGEELGVDQALYVEDNSSQQRYLVYRDDSRNGSATRVVRANVTDADPAVLEMFGLSGAEPRAISTNMLNAIPEVDSLEVPDLPEGSPDYRSGTYQLGDVVSRSVPGQNENEHEYFVLLDSGKQRITRGAAAVLHASRYSSEEIPNATGMLTEVDDADASDELAVQHFPKGVPEPVPFSEADSSCLSWSDRSGEQQVTVTVGSGSPAPKAPVKLAQYDGQGPRVDYFYMPPGKAAVVRGTTGPDTAEGGPIYLVSDRGVTYGIKDLATAKGLGVVNGAGDIKSAPASVLGALPSGDFLDPAQASLVYDSIPMDSEAGVNRPPEEDSESAAGNSVSAGS